MRLAAVCIARNESDIIEPFVRSNLALLDALYLVLHRPEDGTAGIASMLRAEGLALRLFEDRNEGFLQDLRINELTRRAFSEGADFVFPLDADELLQVRDRGALEDILSRLPPGRAGSLRWLTYVPTERDDPLEPNPVRRMRHRVDIGPAWCEAMPPRIDAEYGKLVVGRWFAAHGGARIFEGNHAVLVDDAIAMVPCAGIEVAHFPVRSLEQLTRKALTGWPAYLRSGRDPARAGFAPHWKLLHERCLERGRLTWGDAREFISHYLPPAHRASPLVEAPVAQRCGPLRFAAGAATNDQRALPRGDEAWAGVAGAQ